MKVLVVNKETEQEIEYNALGYDTHGAVKGENGCEPVFQLILDGGETATFHKKDWDLFVLKRA